MFMYETAAYLLSVVPSGAAAFETSHPAKGVMVDGFTPMEAKWNVEMGKAASKMNRAEANKMVQRLLEKYESDIAKPPRGSTYQECYDRTTGKPQDSYIAIYNEVKKELTSMGIPLEL
jgi:methylamine--corrinoid protein Co-methyltransferase